MLQLCLLLGLGNITDPKSGFYFGLLQFLGDEVEIPRLGVRNLQYLILG